MGPALAQLVEHLTVVVSTFKKGRAKHNLFGYTFLKVQWVSKCRWFESGKPETFNKYLLKILIKNKITIKL